MPYQDTQFAATFQITDVPAGLPPGSLGTPRDLTGASFALWIATVAADGSPGTVLVTLSTDAGGGLYVSPNDGLVEMVLTQAQLRLLPTGTLAFDCMRTDQIDPVTGNPEPQRYFGGHLYVREPVTQL